MGISILLYLTVLISSMGADEAQVISYYEPTHLTLIAQMVLVEGGTFQMGSEDGLAHEAPVHKVTVSDFYMSSYEVTVGEYLEFVKATGKHHPEWLEPNSRYHINDGFDDQYKRMGEALTNPNQPVVGVSWYGATAYCAWLSEKDGQAYRLPTEAEWAFAARGGNATAGYTFSGSDDLEEVAWVKTNSDIHPHPVGQKKANELGLYDMTGNVWEWCNDYYGEYPTDDQIDPSGPDAGIGMVFRGGGFRSDPDRCTLSFRNDNPKMAKLKGIGFRVARSLKVTE